MRIAVFGAGGAGAYFGGRWAEAGLDVTLVARGRQLEALRASGLRIESPLGSATIPVRAVAADDDPGPVDFLLVATRVWQLEEAFGALRRLVGPDTAVVGIQNGVEAADLLARAVGPDRVLGGTCRIFSMTAEPGVIRHVGAQPVLTFGELAGGLSRRASDLAKAIDGGASLRAVASPDVQADIWRKFLFFAPASGLGSVTRVPIGTFRAVPESRELLVSAMREVHALAGACGVRLPPESVAESLAFIDALAPASTSSMQRDFQEGRPTELEWLAGAVVRLGRAQGVPTPVHDFLYAALVPLERQAREAEGASTA